MKPDIKSLIDIEKSLYETIIWDIRKPETVHIFGGKDFCPHPDIDKHNRCETCGAYKGFLLDMPFSDYQQRILTELAISPATMNTIIITNRPIGREATLKNSTLAQPKYKEYLWLNKYGSYFTEQKQYETYLISVIKSNHIPSSRVIVNKRGYDPALLDLGQTMIITKDLRWYHLKDNLKYYYNAQELREPTYE